MKWRRAALAWCALCSLSAFATALPERDVPLGAYSYQTNFKDGSLGGWESYPLAQDAGFDPTITPVVEAGVPALMREAAPERPGSFSLGVIHRFSGVVAGSNASLAFRYCLPDSSGSIALRVQLFYGEDSVTLKTVGIGGGWHQAQLHLPVSKRPIQVVTIEAFYKNARPGRNEKFLISDIHLRALRPPFADLLQPDALKDDSREMYFLQRAYSQGENLQLRFADSVRWSLVSPAGHREEGTGQRISHTFSQNDPAGIWTVHASSASGQLTVQLLVRANKPVGLLFDQPPPVTQELLSLVQQRRKALQQTVHPQLGDNISKYESSWLLPGLPSYFALIVPPAELAMLDAIVFHYSGDKEALEQAQTIMLAMTDWDTWVHPWFPAHGRYTYYPVGMAASYLTLAKEYLGESLDASTREKLDAALMRQIIQPAYNEYVRDDRIQFHTSNWIGNTVGGALLAALSNRNPEAAGYALGLYEKQKEHLKASYLSDGTYGEGVSYQRFDLSMSTLVAAAGKRLLGQDMDNFFQKNGTYLRYAGYGSQSLLDFGDTHASLASLNVFAYLAINDHDAASYDLYSQYHDNSITDLLPRLLWESSIGTASSVPTLPLSHIFPDRGVAVVRDSWKSDAEVVAMHAGPNFNHNHADQGSVQIAAKGITWLGEAGYADYYKDPSYGSYVTQAAGHNVLLIDKDEQSQKLPGNPVFGKYPRITNSFLTDDIVFVESDLQPAYSAELTSYHRFLLKRKTGPVLIIDQVTAPVPHKFSVTWHPAQPLVSIDTSRHTFAMQSGDTSLHASIAASSPLEMVQKFAPLPLASYVESEKALIEKSKRLDFETATEQRQALFGSVFSFNTQSAPVEWKQTEKGWQLQADDFTVLVSSSDAKYQDSSTLTAHWPQGTLLVNGTSLELPASRWNLVANDPLTLSLVQVEHGQTVLQLEAAKATKLTISNPHEFSMNQAGTQTNPSKQSKWTIQVPVGKSEWHLSTQ
ncbi:heparinase II/III-family protein [Edaphobacter flagellatus]|uniref:heparinase II/III-family protein n=1 Tax=Edaphobacter flagellatus TaxID=1933044 RepID=UPI0021B1BD43|nr:heparinase II/III-family protein [Edaphobacter flagellatus]